MPNPVALFRGRYPESEPGTTWPQFKGANLAVLASDRFELHPWRLPPSRVVGRIAPGRDHRTSGRSILWRNLAGLDWRDFIEDLANRLPTANVYVTIDKDVLHPGEAVTNWNQGEMRIDHIADCLSALARRRRIVGLDVCGEFSPPRFRHWGKRILAHLDQPPPPRTHDPSVNDAANARLLDVLDVLGV
ncbi:MAG: hypothetical protein M0006_00750 [Magnetospirillum sp.]|nr:hypothetical protein [Magnetospirillum sp.]